MIVKYVNSLGKELILNSSELRISEANFHSYSWKYTYQSKKNGINVNEFKKDEATYPIKLCAFGSLDRRKEMFNEFLDITEYDVARNMPGKLWFGDWYLECFVIESETTPNKNYYTERNIVIMGPRNEWIKPVTRNFKKQSNNQRASDKKSDYPMDYEYDFSSKVSVDAIVNEGYSDEDFKMIIYGPAINPSVSIGKNIYTVFTEIKEGEYLVIDTQNLILAQYDVLGNETIKYNSRDKNFEIYAKIPLGVNKVIWPGDFGFDITTYEKRSEPKWNLY